MPDEPDPLDIAARMREDWNARAREDAGYYVAFGRRDQDDAEFYATATEMVSSLETELRRVPMAERGDWRALEIGCGPGRLMRPMSRHFVQIDGVDVSDEMIALARQRLSDLPNAHPHHTDGASLSLFEDETFSFVYSYAVFQHIPSREVVLQYLREIHRVMKTGGLARLQFNGLPQGVGLAYDTWAGARFSSNEIMEFAREHDFQVLALEGVGTQYMWTSWLKRPRGWSWEQESKEPKADLRIRRITNAGSSEPVAPSRGRWASISIWVENLPPDAGLQHLRVTVGSSYGTITYIGPPDNIGLQQINAVLPELEETGLLPVEVHWCGRVISPPAVLRVIPPGPSVPSIASVTDGVNLVAGKRIETRTIKLTLEEISRPHELEAFIDGHPVSGLEYFCVDPRPQKFEVNLRLPEQVGPGPHQLEIRMGRRKLAPISIEVVA
ncbi:MAG TPA: class I SAM-dependent methyltransferase [Bryobacteraceae bacterium]|nr:class I SAM-dependent methyltransferase [Bryobacteraceae bacterium]